jgi:hypothetical protein
MTSTARSALDETSAVMIRHNQDVNPVEDPVVLGKAALRRGDWAGARRHFETAIGHKETGPALDGLSDALFYLEELEPSLHHRSRAFARYREEGDLCRAARAALWLAMGYISAYGNAAVANGWLQRAERLVEEAGPCAERGRRGFDFSETQLGIDEEPEERHRRENVADGFDSPFEQRGCQRGLAARQVQERRCFCRQPVGLQACGIAVVGNRRPLEASSPPGYGVSDQCARPGGRRRSGPRRARESFEPVR